EPYFRDLTSFLDLLPVYASHLPLPTRTQDSVTLSRPGLRGGPFTHLESTQLSGRTPEHFTRERGDRARIGVQVRIWD
ncbi:hypothetical protein, partial [Thiolapillus sp.]|uniref:hypothetical protein n=1 Tax=Thiolapillus sp. TaxID=2017437 RepID=UPI003AF958D8